MIGEAEPAPLIVSTLNQAFRIEGEKAFRICGQDEKTHARV